LLYIEKRATFQKGIEFFLIFATTFYQEKVVKEMNRLPRLLQRLAMTKW